MCSVTTYTDVVFLIFHYFDTVRRNVLVREIFLLNVGYCFFWKQKTLGMEQKYVLTCYSFHKYYSASIIYRMVSDTYWRIDSSVKPYFSFKKSYPNDKKIVAADSLPLWAGPALPGKLLKSHQKHSTSPSLS